VTSQFEAGAAAAVALAREYNVKLAVLKDLSPSCGSTAIYDGSFTRSRVGGEGVTAAALRREGITVFAHTDLESADAHLRTLA
jgi:uncharacterized protein YbbK (DUF523 family)